MEIWILNSNTDHDSTNRLENCKITKEKKSSSWKQIFRIRKLLSTLANEEVLSKPEFKVTYISNKKPKIVRWKIIADATTAEDSSPRGIN